MAEITQHSPVVVLIVEDNAIQRMNAIQFVQEAGFEVLEAANADEAILLLERRLDIRILFTDIDMPGSMDGLKLSRAVRDRWPPIKIIVTSGQYKIKDGDLPDGSLFFSKPYLPSEIVTALHRYAA